MNKVQIIAVLMLSVTFISSVFAADGTLKATGRVVESSCSLDAPTVAMGQTNLSMLGGGVNDWRLRNPVPFSLKLVNCPKGRFALSFDGTLSKNSTAGTSFALDNADAPETAKNIALILWKDHGDNINNNDDYIANGTVGWLEDQERFDLVASYVPDGDRQEMKPGKANVSIQVSITQL